MIQVSGEFMIILLIFKGDDNQTRSCLLANVCSFFCNLYIQLPLPQIKYQKKWVLRSNEWCILRQDTCIN